MPCFVMYILKIGELWLIFLGQIHNYPDLWDRGSNLLLDHTADMITEIAAQVHSSG